MLLVRGSFSRPQNFKQASKDLSLSFSLLLTLTLMATALESEKISVIKPSLLIKWWLR